MLFNESFAGTNEREGSEIGYQIVRALLQAQITVFFVTHRHAFAGRFRRQHAHVTVFLRAERQADGRRDYRLAVKDPLPTSYGEDLYYRLGGWLEEDEALPRLPAPPRPANSRWSGRAEQAADGDTEVTWRYAGVSRSCPECEGVAMVMTQQYLAGQLSVILGEIQAAAVTQACARQAWDLRLEVESAPVSALPPAAARALALANSQCWEALALGDATAFARQAAVCAELHEFGVCAHLLDEELTRKHRPPGGAFRGEARANGREYGRAVP